jgi:hypothetical protein
MPGYLSSRLPKEVSLVDNEIFPADCTLAMSGQRLRQTAQARSARRLFAILDRKKLMC